MLPPLRYAILQNPDHAPWPINAIFIHGLVPETSLGCLYTATDIHCSIYARSGRLRFYFRPIFRNLCNRRLSCGVHASGISEAYYPILVRVSKYEIGSSNYPSYWLWPDKNQYHCKLVHQRDERTSLLDVH